MAGISRANGVVGSVKLSPFTNIAPTKVTPRIGQTFVSNNALAQKGSSCTASLNLLVRAHHCPHLSYNSPLLPNTRPRKCKNGCSVALALGALQARSGTIMICLHCTRASDVKGPWRPSGWQFCDSGATWSDHPKRGVLGYDSQIVAG